MRDVAVVEPSKVATVAILGGSTQWFEPGMPVDLICAATGSEIVDRIQWVKVDGALPDNGKEAELGVLHISKFKVRCCSLTGLNANIYEYLVYCFFLSYCEQNHILIY